MIVVSSGLDCAGKSSIIKNLNKSFKAEVTHFSAPKNKEDAKKEYFDFIDKANVNKKYICDRFYEGEWTYAPVYRNYTGDYAREIEKKLITHNYLYVQVEAELETLLNRARSRGEDFTKEEDFQTIMNNYDKFLLDQRLPFCIIDNGKNGNIKKNADLIKNNIYKLNTIWNMHRNNFKNGLTKQLVLPRGNINPEYIVLCKNKDILSAYNDSQLIDKLKEKGIYLKCWFTNSINNQYSLSPSILDLDYEMKILNPKGLLTEEDILNG